MFHRQTTTAAPRHGHPGPAPQGGPADPDVPTRACCCPARPLVKVMMPAAHGRRHPVDLWLCGHHYRESRAALAAAGARVRWLPTADYEPLGATSGAGSAQPR